MAIAALMPSDPDGVQWRSVLQHRFGGQDDIGGHALGNLVMAALWEETGDIVGGLDILSSAMRTRGRVLPHALTPADLIAAVRTGEEIRAVRGQAEVSATRGHVESLQLDPTEPTPCPPAIEAIESADVMIFGPGSWFTSVLPHLLVPSIRQAMDNSAAHRVLIVNLSGEVGEAEGYPAHAYLRSWARLFPGVQIGTVIADGAHVDNVEALIRESAIVGADVKVCDVARNGVHDPEQLATVLRTLPGLDT